VVNGSEPRRFAVAFTVQNGVVIGHPHNLSVRGDVAKWVVILRVPRVKRAIELPKVSHKVIVKIALLCVRVWQVSEQDE